MTRLLKILAWIVGALILLVLAAAISLPLFINPNDYRQEIAAQVKKRTGRQLVINGDLKLSVFPWLGVDAGATELGNAPGFGPEPFAQFDHAKVAVKLLPLLLRREVQLDTVKLDKLRLHLARDSNGRNNWDDLIATAGKESAGPPNEPAARRLRLGGIEVRDAQITWDDKLAHRTAQVDKLNVSTGALDLRSPVRLDLDTDFSISAPQLAGHLSTKGVLHHDESAQRYRTENLILNLDAHGPSLPGGAARVALSGDVAADLKAQTAEAKALRLDGLGAELLLNVAAAQILGKPDLKGDLDLRVKDPKTLTQAIAPLLPARLRLQPETLKGARLTTPFTLSLADDTASLPDLRATALGAALGARVAARSVTGKPAARGTLRLEIKDGRLLTAPFADALPKAFQPAQLNGTVIESSFDGDLAGERLALNALRLDALGLHLTGDAQGRALLSRPAFSGQLAVAPFVPRDLLGRLGLPPPATTDPTALAKASLTTRFDAGTDHADFQNLQLKLDQSTLTGRAAAPRLKPLQLRYDLAVDQLDLDRYLPPPKKGNEPAATSAATAPLQLPAKELRALDVNGTLRIGQLKAANLRSSDVVATLRGSGGQLRLSPMSARLYQGAYAGALGLDARSDTPRLEMNEQLTGVQLGPLLQDFMGKPYVTGKGQLNAQLTASGTDALQIRRTLSGNGAFALTDGSVNGINLGQLLRSGYARYKGQPAPPEEARKTDFAELRGTVSVNDGLVTNKDLTAQSPLLRVNGEGTVNLVNEQVDYRVNTTVVSSFEGQGSLAPLKGFAVPVRITGSLSQPQFGVDVASALQNQARQAVESQRQKLQRQLEEAQKKQQQNLQKQLEDKLKNLLK